MRVVSNQYDIYNSWYNKAIVDSGGKMTTPKEIVCSLETGKLIDAAGWTKPTVFVWIKEAVGGEMKWHLIMPDFNLSGFHYYPAPTSAEVELPNNVVDEKGCAAWMVLNKQHTCHAVELDNGTTLIYKAEGKTEVEAKCKMWLHLKEKGII